MQGRQKHRLAQSFKSKVATERARKAPKKEKSHTPATANITRDLGQLLTDLKSWPKGSTDWMRKLRSTK